MTKRIIKDALQNPDRIVNKNFEELSGKPLQGKKIHEYDRSRAYSVLGRD